MTSRFGNSSEASNHDGWFEVFETSSERFRFFKVRIHGVLQLVKQPKETFRHDLVTLSALKKEFNLCYGLSHPGIPRYYAMKDDRIYEEFIDGNSLRELIASNDPRLSDNAFVASICEQLFDILQYIHSHGIVHLDIKPENVLITSIGEPKVKLIDFGAAVSAENSTTPGFTPSYMAPEQLDGQPNFYTDIYLAGLLIKELAEAGSVTRKWRKFVRTATAQTPAQRFKSCHDAVGHIPRSKNSVFRHPLYLLIIAVVALLVAGILATVYFQAAPAAPTQTAATAQAGIEELPAMPTADEDTAVSVPEPPNQTVAEYPQKSTRERLKQLIHNRVQAVFDEKVEPIIENRDAYMEEGRMSRDGVLTYNGALMDAYNICVAFGDSLAGKNPEYADYIESEISRTVESVAGKNHQRFHNY